VAVLGLGNVLMGDDALGPYVVAVLRAGWDFPAGVAVEDLGTPGLDLHPHLAGRRAVVLVDTVRADGAAGTVRVYSRDDLLARPPGPRTSPHDPGVKEALLALEFAGGGPQQVTLVGVIPAHVDHGSRLSDAVRGAVPEAADAVVAELSRLGVAARRRPEPGEPDLWWERENGAGGPA
jgi:hydrogenase maturation protease